MPVGNWREVLLSGPYAVKLPRPERVQEARFLNLWEHEMWTHWRPKFRWPHLCPVLWYAPSGEALVMSRASANASAEEIESFEAHWMDTQRLRLPSVESKPAD